MPPTGNKHASVEQLNTGFGKTWFYRRIKKKETSMLATVNTAIKMVERINKSGIK